MPLGLQNYKREAALNCVCDEHSASGTDIDMHVGGGRVHDGSSPLIMRNSELQWPRPSRVSRRTTTRCFGGKGASMSVSHLGASVCVKAHRIQ